MNLQETKPLSDIYTREEEFSADLAKNLKELRVGNFEYPKTEAKVGTRKADIVATGEDGTLVVENQFGKANWDHWGRLEAYARLKEADVAVLVAERFEELMIVTCNLRNEDSKTDWYLIQVLANSYEELSFHFVVRPAIDIQTEHSDVEFNEFWDPIRNGELGELFVGKPVPVGNDWVSKTIKGINIWLWVKDKECNIRLWFKGKDREERRDKVMELFPAEDYDYKYKDAEKAAIVIFPVLSKGMKDEEDWDEIRQELVSLGTNIYNEIKIVDL